MRLNPACGTSSAIAAVIAAIVFATLTPTGDTDVNVGGACLGCGTFGLPDLILNVMLFAPMGLILGRLGISITMALGVGVAFSGGIETLQLFIPGRSSTLRDVLANTMGCGLGAALGASFPALLQPGRRLVLLMAASGSALLSAVALTGLLSRFAPPTSGDYFGQWVTDRSDLEQWRGTVQRAVVDGIDVPNGRNHASTPALRRALADTVRVRITGTAGPPTVRTGGIFGLVTESMEDALLVGPHGRDLVVRVRREAARVRLRDPEFRFRDALAAVPAGAPLELSIKLTQHGGCARVNGTPHCVGRQRLGSAWMLGLGHYPETATRDGLLRAFTLFVLAFPFALSLWSTAGIWRGFSFVLLGIAVPLVGYAAGLALPDAWECASLALTLVVGWSLNARLRRAAVHRECRT